MKAIANGKVPFEREVLTDVQQFNEYVLIRLRTQRGVSANEVKELFAGQFDAHFKDVLDKMREAGYVETNGARAHLTRSGKLMADHVVTEMLADDEKSYI